MKKLLLLFITSTLFVGLLSGCGGSVEETDLDPKHKELPDYVLNAKEEVKEAYILAAHYPEVLSSVPCYCGCYTIDGHTSNLDCFVDGMDSENAVTGWDTMGIS